MKKVIAALGLSATALVSAPSSHADTQGYLSYLSDRGVVSFSPSNLVLAGNMSCEKLHAGQSPADAANNPMALMWGAVIVEAAQHELCPDTLR